MGKRIFRYACKFRYDEERTGKQFKGPSDQMAAMKHQKYEEHTVYDRCAAGCGWRHCLYPCLTHNTCPVAKRRVKNGN